MKKQNIYICLGLGIYALTALIDRFICSIPDFIYIPILIIGIASILFGAIKDKKDK